MGKCHILRRKNIKSAGVYGQQEGHNVSALRTDSIAQHQDCQMLISTAEEYQNISNMVKDQPQTLDTLQNYSNSTRYSATFPSWSITLCPIPQATYSKILSGSSLALITVLLHSLTLVLHFLRHTILPPHPKMSSCEGSICLGSITLQSFALHSMVTPFPGVPGLHTCMQLLWRQKARQY